MERFEAERRGCTPPVFVSRGNKGLTGEIRVSRGNKGVSGEFGEKFEFGVPNREKSGEKHGVAEFKSSKFKSSNNPFLAGCNARRLRDGKCESGAGDIAATRLEALGLEERRRVV